MPPTSYIAYNRGNKRHMEFRDLPHFKWLLDGAIFNNFTKDTDTRDIIKTLSRDVNKTVIHSAGKKHRASD